jgi:hypothetical protein
MKLAEILESLHRMQKETTKLLFEIPVNDNALIRGAVAEADLTLGNAATAVRRHLSRNRIACLTPAEIREDARETRAAFRRAVPPATNGFPAQGSVSPDDELSDGEDLAYLGQRDRDYLDTIRHPDDAA